MDATRCLNVLVVVFSSIAAVLSLVLIMAMTIPLLFTQNRKVYSSYNLYLAYLGISDVIANAFYLYCRITYNRWKTDDSSDENKHMRVFDHKYDHAMLLACTTANLYMNTFLTIELYKLVKDSSMRRKHHPPTLWKVTGQAMISFGLGIFWFVFDATIIDRLFEKVINDTAAKNAYFTVAGIICVAIPMLLMISLTVKAFWKNLFGTVRSMYQGRMRIMFWYFTRIIVLEILVYLPSSVAYAVYHYSKEEGTRVLAYYAMELFASLEIILSFGCALTKPDARNLVLEFLRLEYCCRWSKEDEGERKLSLISTKPATKESDISEAPKIPTATKVSIDVTDCNLENPSDREHRSVRPSEQFFSTDAFLSAWQVPSATSDFNVHNEILRRASTNLSSRAVGADLSIIT